jgi:hypothetical protein
MVDISEGMASTLKPAQNIYKKDLFNPVSHQTTQMNNDPDLKPCRLYTSVIDIICFGCTYFVFTEWESCLETRR